MSEKKNADLKIVRLEKRNSPGRLMPGTGGKTSGGTPSFGDGSTNPPMLDPLP